MADGRSGSELAKRTVTALAMLLVSGTALWLGGMAWMVFVLIIGIGVWFEWSALALLMYPSGGKRSLWRYGGAIYCGMACAVLLALRDMPMGLFWVLLIVAAVIATDVWAYFSGRLIGGPKIAPKISPSKTWAGLAGGIIGASLVIYWLMSQVADPDFAKHMAQTPSDLHDTYFVMAVPFGSPIGFVIAGAAIAIMAQAGDFFESWMKREAGVKDSGKLLPGHGGLFDRVDGLLAVLVVFGNVLVVAQLMGAA